MKFKIMGSKGDNVAVYEDVETQQMKFDELLASGQYLPIASQGGKQPTLLKVFDPTLEEIIWMPVVGGG